MSTAQMATAGDGRKRSPREALLAQAAAAAAFDEPSRRFAVKGLVHMRYRAAAVDGRLEFPSAPLCEEAEILAAAYGDPAGYEYWRAWFYHPMSADELADLIAVHAAESEHSLPSIRRRLREALEPLTERRQAAHIVRALLANPDTRELVPLSLREYARQGDR